MLEVPGFFWSGYGNEMATSLLSAASAKMPGVSGDSALAISTRRLDTKVEVSNKRGTTVPVMMLMFNDETFAEKYLADGLRAIGIGLAHFGFVPHFYFYDNSTDATPAILQELSAKFPITLVSEPLPDCVPKGGGSRSSDRCNRIGACRNALMGMALDCIVKAPLVVFMDTNIFAGAGCLVELVHAAVTNPRVGLATACTASATNREHYYDIYAYSPVNVLENHRLVSHVCPMKDCQERMCKTHRRSGWPLLAWNSTKLFDVFSAFGGLAVGRPEAVLAGRWRSEFDRCEHVAFCRDLRAAGYRVVIVPQAHALWISDLTQVSPATLKASHNQIKRPVAAATAEKMWKTSTSKDERVARACAKSAGTSGHVRAPPSHRPVPVKVGRVRLPRV